MKFFPTGGNAIVDARDVANVMVKLMSSEIHSERYLLIGSNQKFKLLFDKIADEMGKKKPSIKANKGLLNVARIVLSFFAFLQAKRSPITKETINSACDTVTYSSDKIKKAVHYTFYSLDETIENAIAGKIS